MLVAIILALSFLPTQLHKTALSNNTPRKQRIIGPYKIIIKTQNSKQIQKIARLGIIIDNVNNGTLTAYATKQDLGILQKHKIPYKHIKPDNGPSNENTSGYYTYETLTFKLQELQERYPEILNLISIGKTVSGREMWFVKISDNVALDEAEPEFKFISTMHGDEVVGQEMLVKLIDHLAANYQRDPKITELVNSTEIWIMPNMNPDGTAMRRRHNSNYVDLNRDFPDPTSDYINTKSGRAIETQNVMRFTEKHNFVLSANFHGGAVVVNYPWDSQNDLMPEDALARKLSLEYSKRNLPMYNSRSFPQGITNGYDWYPIYGGMQDWNYHWHNCLDVTIELSQNKWPNYSTIENYWGENKNSLLAYINQIHYGMKGFVYDARSMEPIKANYKIQGLDKTFYSFLPHGDFYKLLLPGNYTVEFFAEGYKSKTININVEKRKSLPVRIELEPKN